MSVTTVGSKDDTRFPLTRTDWLCRRSLRFRRCSYSNKIIWPWQLTYYRETAYGEANSEMHTWDIHTEWITPVSYTHKILTETK